MAFLVDYTLLDEIGHGAFASVYKVRHNTLGYVRAIRVLNQVIARGEDDPLWHKFVNECRILLRLGNGNNPHIVHIYQPLLRESQALVEMDYIDGKDLHHYLDDHNRFVEAEEVERLAREMAEALAFCHHDIFRSSMDRDVDNLIDDPEDGSRVLIDRETEARLVKKYQVIHNDLHSGNIMRRNDGGGFVLLDFGLSIQDGDVLHSSKRRGGAPEYKAPEKWDNEGTITCQSDIYSLGVILYEALTGQVPFAYDTRNPNSAEAEYLLMNAIKKNPVPDILRARKKRFEATHPGEQYVKDYPEWLEVLILKCLAKDPADRFDDGLQLKKFIKTHTSTGHNGPSLDQIKQELKDKQAIPPVPRTVPPPRIVPPPRPPRVSPPQIPQPWSGGNQEATPVQVPPPPKKKKTSAGMIFIYFILALAIGVIIAFIFMTINENNSKNNIDYSLQTEDSTVVDTLAAAPVEWDEIDRILDEYKDDYVQVDTTAAGSPIADSATTDDYEEYYL